jgi:hypothetical protein
VTDRDWCSRCSASAIPGAIKNIEEHGVLYDGSFPVWNRQSTVDAVLECKPENDDTWLHVFATGEERRATPQEARAFGPWESDLEDKVLTRPQDLDETHRILDARISPDRSKVAYRYFLDDRTKSRQISYVLYVKPVRGGTPLLLTSLTGYVKDYGGARTARGFITPWPREPVTPRASASNLPTAGRHVRQLTPAITSTSFRWTVANATWPLYVKTTPPHR